jgi:hypothetical protein
MGDDTPLDFSHLDKVLIMEAFQGEGRHGEIREVDLELLMELVPVEEGLLMLRLFKLIVVEVVPLLGSLPLNALLDTGDVSESLDFVRVMLLAHFDR